MFLTKSKIKSAGRRIRNFRETEEDIKTINLWRSNHRYIIKQFSNRLDIHMKKNKNISNISESIIQGQRLKRFETIKDKLQNRSEGMCLYKMNDIAGSRLIFNNMNDIDCFMKSVEFKGFELLNSENRISNPKKTGYKSIHNIYSYISSRDSSPYNNMKIELQIRTRYQHYWATAVEMYDLITNSRCKFSTGDTPTDVELYFQYTSELFTRAFENKTGYLKEISDARLIANIFNSEIKLKVSRKLYNLKSIKNFPKLKHSKGRGLHNIVMRISITSLTVEVFNSSSESKVIKKYEEWEKKYPKDVPVYILGATKKEIEECFKNYFFDTKDYTDAMVDALFILLEKSFKKENFKSRLYLILIKKLYYYILKPILEKNIQRHLTENNK